MTDDKKKYDTSGIEWCIDKKDTSPQDWATLLQALSTSEGQSILQEEIDKEFICHLMELNGASEEEITTKRELLDVELRSKGIQITD